MITASMATFPPRFGVLEEAVRSLVGQVDRLRVYVNAADAPAYLDQPKVEVALAPDGDLGDAGKFWWAWRGELPAGLHLTVDDDLAYPPDYARTHRFYHRSWQAPVAVSAHGHLFPGLPLRSYLDDQITYRCLGVVRNDTWVHGLGTGVLSYRVGDVVLAREDFPTGDAADLYFSAACQRQGVPQLVMRHAPQWLRYLLPLDADTIWTRSRADDSVQTAFVNAHRWTVRKARAAPRASA